MPSLITWVDHDAKARERATKLISLFSTPETRDELGLGSITGSIADILFPGTSSVQNRLRYVFFVPWLYQILETKEVSPNIFGKKLDDEEKDLIPALKSSPDNRGTVGSHSGEKIKRLPSSIYWNALSSWGIKLKKELQETYHRSLGVLYSIRKRNRSFKKPNKDNTDSIDLNQSGTGCQGGCGKFG
jgi:hypothetical protein